MHGLSMQAHSSANAQKQVRFNDGAGLATHAGSDSFVSTHRDCFLCLRRYTSMKGQEQLSPEQWHACHRPQLCMEYSTHFCVTQDMLHVTCYKGHMKACLPAFLH